MLWLITIWLSLVVIIGFLIPLAAASWYLQGRYIRASSIFRRCFPRSQPRRQHQDIESVESHRRSQGHMEVDARSTKRSHNADKQRFEGVTASERSFNESKPKKRMRRSMRSGTHHRRRGANRPVAAGNLPEEVHARVRALLAPVPVRHALRGCVQRRGTVHNPRGSVRSQRATVHRRAAVESDYSSDSD